MAALVLWDRSGSKAKKSRRIYLILRLFIGPARPSIDDDVINRPRIADIRIKNLHSSARFDRGLDDFALLVHDVTRSVEDVGAGRIGTILPNNKCLDRLVIGRRPFLS